jgi:hypothetical protein
MENNPQQIIGSSKWLVSLIGSHLCISNDDRKSFCSVNHLFRKVWYFIILPSRPKAVRPVLCKFAELCFPTMFLKIWSFFADATFTHGYYISQKFVKSNAHPISKKKIF